MSQKSYDYKKTLIKGLEYFVYSGVPALIGFLLDSNPFLFSISVGTLLKLLSDYLKHKHDDDVFDKMMKKISTMLR